MIAARDSSSELIMVGNNANDRKAAGKRRKNSVKRPQGFDRLAQKRRFIMAAALEAFCLLRSAEMQNVVRQKEESHETAAKYPVLMRINALYHVVNVYISDAPSAD